MCRDADPLGGGHAWVRLPGDLPVICVPDQVDFSNARELEAALTWAARGHATVVVDMTQTGYCGSSGLRALALAAGTASASGGRLLLAAGAPAVLRVLALTGLDQLLQVCASLPEAIAATPAPAQTRSTPPGQAEAPATRPA